MLPRAKSNTIMQNTSFFAYLRLYHTPSAITRQHFRNHVLPNPCRLALERWSLPQKAHIRGAGNRLFPALRRISFRSLRFPHA